MRSHLIALIILYTLVNRAFLIAQERPGKNFLSNGLQQTQSVGSGNSLWDRKLFYFATPKNSNQTTAGATYVPYMKEIWVSHFDSDTLYRYSAKGDTANLLESTFIFTIAGVTNIRGMTCDDFSVYAANFSDTIYVINPANRTLEGTIIAPMAIQYITYDPTADQGNGGFWVGNFETDPAQIDYSGSVLKTLNYANLGTTNIFGAAFDNLTANGPYLWVFGQTGGYGQPQEISQVSLLSGNATGLKHRVDTDFTGSQATSLAGGLFIANGVYPGKLLLGGILQGATDYLFGYEIASTSFNVSKSFSFGDPAVSSSYRIISIPGDVNIPVSELVASAGSQKKDWNIYYDNGQADNYLVEYSNSGTFTFKPGNAFWALSRNPLNISRPVINVIPDIRNMYSIPLHAGWNLISNPFNKTVSWAAVQTANGLSTNELVYQWAGSWTNPQSLNPYEGYYYNNINSFPTLFIPVTTFLGKSRAVNDYGLKTFLKITACLKDSQYAALYATQNSGSAIGFDPHDYFAPPSDFSQIDIHLYNKDLKTQYKNLFIDSRPEITDGEEFSIHLKNTMGQKINLKVSGQENYSGYEIWLVNNRSNKSYDLKTSKTVDLEPFNGTEDFKLIIGSADFIAKEKNKMQPLAYSLSQNYPNPFNPSTIISYELPQKSFIELEIYDVLGKLVETLVKKEQPAGSYEIKFDGIGLSSGLYLYKLKAGDFVQTKKMMLVK